MEKSNSDYYLKKFLDSVKGRVAVFIDAANLEKSVQDMWVHPRDVPDELRTMSPDDLCWRVDYKALKDFFKQNFSLQQISFYTARFGTDGHDGFLTVMKRRFGYRLVTKAIKIFPDDKIEEPHRKADFDVEISVDATYALSDYDTIILFSGDSDFAYLLRFLRNKGKKTILFSRKGHVAKELFPEVDNYLDVVDFRHIFLRVSQKAKNPA